MLRYALALALFVFGACVKDGSCFLAGGMGLAGHSKGRATKVKAQRLMPGDACPRHGTGGISEEPDRNRPIISSSLGQTRATPHSRLLDVFGEVEVGFVCEVQRSQTVCCVRQAGRICMS